MPPKTARGRLFGIGLIVVTGFFFTVLDSSAKWLGHHLPTMEVAWARYASSLLVLLPFVNPWNTPAVLRPRRPFLQIARGELVLGSTVTNFVALHYLQLAQTVSISFSTPLLVAVIAGPLLGDWMGWCRGLAVAMGFLGVVVVAQPGLSGFHWAMGLSFAGAACYAVGNIVARVLVRDDEPTVALFALGLFGTLALAPFVPAVWVTPSALDWALMAALGSAAAVGHYCLILAHRYAPASVLAPFIYTQMIWMVLSGWLVFGDVPNAATIGGAAIVIAAGIYLLLLERAFPGGVRRRG